MGGGGRHIGALPRGTKMEILIVGFKGTANSNNTSYLANTTSEISGSSVQGSVVYFKFISVLFRLERCRILDEREDVRCE